MCGIPVPVAAAAAAVTGMALSKAGFMIVGDSVRVGQRVRFMVRLQTHRFVWVPHFGGGGDGGGAHDTLLSSVSERFIKAHAPVTGA